MRVAVLLLAGIETLAFAIVLVAAWQEDSSEIRIVLGLARLAVVPFLLGTAPALILAIWNRHLWLAGALALGVVVLATWVYPRL